MGTGERHRECLSRPAGSFQLHGHERLTPDVRARSRRVGGPAVEPSSLGLHDVLVDDVADQGVSEAIATGCPGRQQEGLLSEFLQRRTEVRGRPPGHGGQHLQVEGAADDRPGACDLDGLR